MLDEIQLFAWNHKNVEHPEWLEFANVPDYITYVWDKSTQQFYEKKIISYPVPILMKDIQWRNVTRCFDWIRALEENKLPPEKSFLQKVYCFLFSSN